MPTLDWLNRDDAFLTAQRVPTRVLRPHASAPASVGDAAARAGNLLIQGDNLEALKALLPFYRGRVKRAGSARLNTSRPEISGLAAV